jgi:hypothetical protein
MRPQSLAGMSSGVSQDPSKFTLAESFLLLLDRYDRITAANSLQLKQPNATHSRYGASSNVFSKNQAARNGISAATSRINGVNGVNGVNGRPGHARSKSQAPRPRTAHALREEDRYEAPTNNGTTALSQDTSQPITTLPYNKIRISQSFATLPTIRDSSLTSKFLELSLEDKIPPGSQAISRPLTRQSSQSSTASHVSNIPCKRRGRDDQNMTASTSRQTSSERP